MELKNLVPWRKDKGVQLSDPFDQLRSEMDRLFDHFLERRDLGPWPEGTFSPAIDVKDTDDAILVSAELPGIDESELDVSVNRDILTIRGEKREESDKKENGRKYVERSYGMFERGIPLHCAVDESKVKATFKKGVLKITLPKTAEAKNASRKIPISG